MNWGLALCNAHIHYWSDHYSTASSTSALVLSLSVWTCIPSSCLDTPMKVWESRISIGNMKLLFLQWASRYLGITFFSVQEILTNVRSWFESTQIAQPTFVTLPNPFINQSIVDSKKSGKGFCVFWSKSRKVPPVYLIGNSTPLSTLRCQKPNLWWSIPHSIIFILPW